MTSEAEIEIDGHVLRLEFQLSIGRPAPRLSASRYDDTLSDAGEPGTAFITRGWLLLMRNDKAVRERELTRAIVRKLRESDRLEDWIYENALKELPRA